MTTALNKIAVIGGGSWGTALALAAARAGREVTLWARDAETIAAINANKQNRSICLALNGQSKSQQPAS